MAGENPATDLQRCIEEGRRASEALLRRDDADWRGLMLWLADQVGEEVLIRLQESKHE